MRWIQCLLCLLMVCPTKIANSSLLWAETVSLHTNTGWQLKPSLKYDTLCLLNALSGDPYYLHHYQAEYDHFHPLFTPEEQAAFAQLKHVIKDEGNGIISARLTLYYSAVEDEALPEMIRISRTTRRTKDYDTSAQSSRVQIPCERRLAYSVDDEFGTNARLLGALFQRRSLAVYKE
jgi:hypothetical protein